MIKLNLKMNESLFKEPEKNLLATFYGSSTGKTNKKFRFAKLDSHFGNYLPYLKDGAVKLYLYYAFAANNKSGESWHSLATISRNLNATDRSISSWNNELEDMGLIFRTNSGKKSKATYILPLTSFAAKMSVDKIEQVLKELDLFRSNRYTKVFGTLCPSTRLYIKNESKDGINEVWCVHLKRTDKYGKESINCVDAFLYSATPVKDETVVRRLLDAQYEERVVQVNDRKGFVLCGKETDKLGSFYINYNVKVDEADIYDIMSQLTDNVDFSEMPVIEI